MRHIPIWVLVSLGVFLAIVPVVAAQEAKVDPLQEIQQKRIERARAAMIKMRVEIEEQRLPGQPTGKSDRFIRGARTLTAETSEHVLIRKPTGVVDEGLLLDADLEPVINAPAIRAVRQVRLGLNNFDRFLFGNMATDEARQAWLDTLLDEKIEAITKVTPLSPEQQSKLRLAGKGDIKKFFRRAAEKRLEFDEIRNDLNKGVNYLNTMDLFGREFEKGPFFNQSLFAKTWAKMLSEMKVDSSPSPKRD